MGARRRDPRRHPTLPPGVLEDMDSHVFRILSAIMSLRRAEGAADDKAALGRLVLRTQILPRLRALVEATNVLSECVGEAPMTPDADAWLRRQLDGLERS